MPGAPSNWLAAPTRWESSNYLLDTLNRVLRLQRPKTPSSTLQKKPEMPSISGFFTLQPKRHSRQWTARTFIASSISPLTTPTLVVHCFEYEKAMIGIPTLDTLDSSDETLFQVCFLQVSPFSKRRSLKKRRVNNAERLDPFYLNER